MIDYTNSQIEHVAVHYIGNKGNGETLALSESPLQLTDPRLRDMLLKLFVSEFKSEEFNSFTFGNGEIALNPVYNFTSRIFEHPETFQKASKDIATHLFDKSLHPQIRPGELFVVFLSGVELDGQNTKAIGLFKSESKQPFIKILSEKGDFILQFEEGMNVEKLDKGCVIFNIGKEEGYKIAVVDKVSRGNEARFWREDFLLVRPCNDNFHATKIVLDMAKKYVTDQLSSDHEVTRVDQVEYLNRSMEYFKSNESYDKTGFENDVFKDPEMITSFRKFDQKYREENYIGEIESFDISVSAVKQQARHFKNVIKLDKNFHIYIHGNKELIEQGIDQKTGKRFYKLYFDEET